MNAIIGDEAHPYEPNKYDVASFELIGYRQDDGTLIIGDKNNGTRCENFPRYVRAFGVIYTLEDVVKNDSIEYAMYA